MASVKTKVRLLPDLDGTEYIEARLGKHRFPLHFHDTFVIQHVTGGTDWCCNNDMTANRDEVFVHVPHAPHTGGSVGADPLCYRAIYPGVNLFQELTKANIRDLSTKTATVISDSRFVGKVRALLDACKVAKVADGTRIRSQMKSVFESLLDLPQPIPATRSKTPPILCKLKIARDYLVQHYARDVTTAELTSVCQISEYHLIRSFRNHFGITPRQFLICRRVAAAKHLIAAGVSVAAAAHTCGFADQSHLHRNFKKVTGYTPGRLAGACGAKGANS